VTSYPGGDHAVFLGQVERMERSQRRPLVFGGGKYMTAFPQDLGGFSLDLGIADLAHLHAVRVGAAAVSRLAAEIGTTTCLAVWGSHGPTVIRWEESARPVSATLRTGIVLPVLRSAVGQVLGAFLPRALTTETIEAELRQFAGPSVAPFASPEDALSAMDFTDSLSAALIDQLVEVNLAGAAAQARRKFIMSRADAETLLSGVRARGLARNLDLDTDDSREDKVVAFAAPVFDAQGLPVLAMAALCYARECQDGWRASAPQSLGRMARELSAQLGYSDRPSGAK
jgi:DNA-binding IclR family transcriptional regulator